MMNQLKIIVVITFRIFIIKGNKFMMHDSSMSYFLKL